MPPEARCLGLCLSGDAIDDVDKRGNRIVDENLLILLNAHHEPISMVLPACGKENTWELILDTREATGRRRHDLIQGGGVYEMEARSLALMIPQREE